MGADDSHDLKPRNDQLGERAKTASRKAPLSEEPRPGADRKLSARKKLCARHRLFEPAGGSRPLDPGAVGG
jgi:hypothetical protein